MPQLDVAGVQVEFPFTPYDVQVQYMEKVVRALQQGSNALLESPTGTGKTLCLLCAALAWQQTQVAHTQAMAVQERSGAAGQRASELSQRLQAASGDARRKAVSLAYDDGPSTALALPGRTYSYADAAATAASSASAQPAPAPAPGHTSSGGAAGASIRHPVIVYASRTHSQLSQVTRELKKTVYSPRVSVLGSREQLCVHPTVGKARGPQQNTMCRALTADNECGYKRRLQAALGSGPRSAADVLQPDDSASAAMDIEELAAAGKEKRVCPFYLSRDPGILAQADIVLVPYSYLVDPTSRRALQVDWQNAVLIFDEAHNLEDWCTAAMSFDLTAATVANCVQEVDLCLSRLREREETGQPPAAATHGDGDNDPAANVSTQDLLVLKALLLGIEDEVAKLEPDTRSGSRGLISREGKFMFDLFAKFKLTRENHSVFTAVLDAVVSMLLSTSVATARASGANAEAALSQAAAKEPSLTQLATILNRLFRGSANSAAASASLYRVYVHEPEAGRGGGGRKDVSLMGSRRGPSGRTLSYWCFSAGVAMQELAALGVHNVVLTSGTLSPLASFAQEMLLPFPNTLENAHVVDGSQVLVRALPQGPTRRRLNSSYRLRDDPEYQAELGLSVLALARVVPEGLLVFFPSYGVLAACEETWQRREIWAKIDAVKPIVREPKGSKAEFMAAKQRFETLAEDRERGATFLAVCRGKVSEGVDFSDHRARCVVVTGLPFPPARAPRVLLKQQFLDQARREVPAHKRGSMLEGRHWYAQQASRAVNQAVGRVIRHRHDYGAIVLADERFATQQQRERLSRWLRPFWRPASSFDELQQDMRAFYSNARRATERMRASTAEAEAASGETYVGARGGFTVVGRVDTGPVPRALQQQQQQQQSFADMAQGAAAGGAPATRGGAYAAREERRKQGGGSVPGSGPGAVGHSGGAPSLDAVLSGSVQGAVERGLGAAQPPAPKEEGREEEEEEEEEERDPKRRRLGSRLGSALRVQEGSVASGPEGGGGPIPTPSGPAPSLLDRLRSAGASRRGESGVEAGSEARPRRKRPAPGATLGGDGARQSTPEGASAPAEKQAGDGGGRGAKEAAARAALQRVKGALSAAAFTAFKGVLSRMRAQRRAGKPQRSEDGRELVQVLTQAVGSETGLDMAEACCAALPAPCAAVVRAAAQEARPKASTAVKASAGEAPQDAKGFLAELRRRCAETVVAAWRAGVKELHAALGSARKRGVAPGEDAGVRAAMDHVRGILARADSASEQGSAPLVSAFTHCLPQSAREAYLRLVAVKGAAPTGADLTSGTHMEDRARAADLARRGVVTHDLVTGRPLPVERVAAEAERVRREEEERERIAALRAEAEQLARDEAAELAAGDEEGGGDDGEDGAEEGSRCGICYRAVTEASRASMLVAPCAHVCCTGCWDKWLVRRLECPFCRARVRAKQLRPLSEGPWRVASKASEQ